jgi:hypothetical protein
LARPEESVGALIGGEHREFSVDVEWSSQWNGTERTGGCGVGEACKEWTGC